MEWNKKSILLLTDWYEPGYKAGGPIQSCRNFAMAMSSDYSIWILTSDRDLGDAQPYENIKTDTWINGSEGPKVYYASPGRLGLKKMREIVEDIQPDYIYLNSMYSLNFTLLPLWLLFRKKIRAQFVISPRGMLQEGALKFKSLKKKIFLKVFNLSGITSMMVFHATDEQEKTDIRRQLPGAGKVLVIPNIPRTESPAWKEITKAPGYLKCVFISRVAPKKNILFLLEVLQQLPVGSHIELNLYGEIEEEEYWDKCLRLMESLPASIQVFRKGPIPNAQVMDVLQQHHLFVLPTLGENFGHSIFEALLAGKPVLISDKTPWRDLARQQVGHDLPLEKGEFVQALLFYLGMDQVAYNNWSVHAVNYTKHYLAQSNTLATYKTLFA